MREGIWGRQRRGTAWCQQDDDGDEKEAICMGNRERGKREQEREFLTLCWPQWCMWCLHPLEDTLFPAQT